MEGIKCRDMMTMIMWVSVCMCTSCHAMPRGVFACRTELSGKLVANL